MVDMNNIKKEKAIAQALANLQMDRIYIKQEFVARYRQKNNLSPSSGMKLVLKRGGKNGCKR